VDDKPVEALGTRVDSFQELVDGAIKALTAEAAAK
jgi:hypothetical protein